LVSVIAVLDAGADPWGGVRGHCRRHGLGLRTAGGRADGSAHPPT